MPDFPDDVIERVAKALCRLALQPTQTEFTFPSLEARVSPGWKKFIPAAIAALAAAWEWRPIETALPSRDANGRSIEYLIRANYPNGGKTDPVYSWIDEDGNFPRWRHEFPPTLYLVIQFPTAPEVKP